jgi:uncharacterized membrane protein
MTNLPWHPIIVHFPLALVLTGFALLVGAHFLPREPWGHSLAHAGTWCMTLGGASVLLTLATGVAAVLDLSLSGAARESVSRHMIWAVCTSQWVVLLALWRALGTDAGAIPSKKFLAGLLLACAALVITGYHGGENVYHYGLGTALAAP